MTELIAARLLFTPDSEAHRFLPEGPYPASDGRISWVAIQHGPEAKTGSLNLLDPNTGQNKTFNLPGRPGFAFPTSDPDVYIIGAERQLALFHLTTQTWEVLVDGIDSHTENTIINDGVVFGDCLIFGCKELEFKTPKAGLYLYRRGANSVVSLRNDQICSNGKAVIRHEGGLGLVDIDSPTQKITVSPLDLDTGTLGPPQTVVDLSQEEVFPDGLVVTPDEQQLIVALYNPGRPEFGEARQYAIAGEPDGKSAERIWQVPGSSRVTCPQWRRAGDGLQLILTTADEGMPADLRADYPNAGCLFLADTPFSGSPQTPVFPAL